MDIGVQINKYIIVEHIGRGGMADVWSARDQQLNRMVAVKTIAHGLTQEADPVGLFKDEAQTIAQMEHPHILPIYDFGDFEGQLYIVMRYVAGGSMEDILNRGSLSLNDALRMGQAVAQALDYAHSNNVIHLDLKPPNVLLDSHHSPYLADFGLATKLDPAGKAANPGSGTLLYMAPEQLTAEVIDHRADLYSFGVMMFHMMTGQLPFDGSIPLALKQLQFHEELPELESLDPDLPASFTDILRIATAVDPDNRPRTLMAVIDEMRNILATSTDFAFMTANLDEELDDEASATYRRLAEALPEDTAAEVLEAVDIYARAHHAWSGGNGRFLLGVTHFMIMNDYYMNAEHYQLETDRQGRQLLLRGALEYNIELEYWWEQLDDDDRRWVCLHALRSGSVPSRIRALYRLETLVDSPTPQIPKLVAQALQIETDEQARMAALQVLATRHRLMKQDQVDIKTEFRGRMLTTMTRIGIQILSADEWQEVIYTPEIDLLIAEIALDEDMPKVADFAARVLGRIRSTAAVRYLVRQQKEGRKRTWRVLAIVRDEAPSLPKVANWRIRLYAWGINSLRRMFDPVSGLTFRGLSAMLGAWGAMFMYIWTVYRSEALFTSARWGASIAIGLVFAVIFSAVVLVSGEFSSRLKGFWPWWGRFAVFSLLGLWLAALGWSQYTWFYLNLSPEQNVILFGALGLSLGYSLAAILNLRSYIAVPVTVFLTYVPIWATWEYWWNGFVNIPGSKALFKFLYPNGSATGAIFYFDYPEQIYTVAVPFVVVLSIAGHFPSVLKDIVYVVKKALHQRAARRFEDVRVLPAVPDVDLYAPEAKLAYAATSGMQTELDMNLGFQDEFPGPVTELDVAQGIRLAQEVPATEVDVNLGLETPDELSISTEPQAVAKDGSATKSRRISLSKKRLDASQEVETELDMSQGLPEDGGSGAPEVDVNKPKPKPEIKSRRISLDEKSAAIETGTTLDMSHGKNKLESKPETKSRRISLGKKPGNNELEAPLSTSGVQNTLDVQGQLPTFDLDDGDTSELPSIQEEDNGLDVMTLVADTHDTEELEVVEVTPPSKPVDEDAEMESKRVDIGTGIHISKSETENESPPPEEDGN